VELWFAAPGFWFYNWRTMN